MKEIKIYKPGDGFLIHVTGMPGAGKTTLIGDMLLNEQQHGPCAYLFTKREGNDDSGGWMVLPRVVLEEGSNTRIIFLETIGDVDTLFKDWKRNPLRALGVDTSTGFEQLIRKKITGSDTKPLRTTTGNFQHKEFKENLQDYISDFREVAKYTILVSPAVPTAYNQESASNDTGLSGTSIDADKRFSPDGENVDSRAKLLYLCDYAFHIKQGEKSSGAIKDRTLWMQPSLKYNTKARLPLGRECANIVLDPIEGANWPKLKGAIEEVFRG